MTPRPTAEERAEQLASRLIGMPIDGPDGWQVIAEEIRSAEAAVREECAQIAEQHPLPGSVYPVGHSRQGLDAANIGPALNKLSTDIADAIRKGGKE